LEELRDDDGAVRHKVGLWEYDIVELDDSIIKKVDSSSSFRVKDLDAAEKNRRHDSK